MFTRAKNFLGRHWKKIVLTGVAVEGAVLFLRYAERKFQAQQLKRVQEMLDQTRHQQHFESTERTCNVAITTLFPAMKDAISKALDCDSMTLLLKNKAPNKVDIWEQLKLLSFSRVTALVYCGALLVTMLRTQLGIISGIMYQKMTRKEQDKDLQQAYISACEYFFAKGIGELCTEIEAQVKTVVGAIPLKQHLTLQDLDQIFWAIQSAVNGMPQEKNLIRSPWKYLFPSEALKREGPETSADHLVLDTIDVMESEEVKSLLTSCVSQGFSHMVDLLAEHFTRSELNHVKETETDVTMATIETQPNKTEVQGKTVEPPNDQKTVCGSWVNSVLKDGSGRDGEVSFVHPNQVSVPLAKLIPIVSGLVHYGDSWMQFLIVMDNVKQLGANIYESFCQEQAEN